MLRLGVEEESRGSIELHRGDRYQEEPPTRSHPTAVTVKLGAGESRRRKEREK